MKKRKGRRKSAARKKAKHTSEVRGGRRNVRALVGVAPSPYAPPGADGQPPIRVAVEPLLLTEEIDEGVAKALSREVMRHFPKPYGLSNLLFKELKKEGVIGEESEFEDVRAVFVAEAEGERMKAGALIVVERPVPLSTLYKLHEMGHELGFVKRKASRKEFARIVERADALVLPSDEAIEGPKWRMRGVVYAGRMSDVILPVEEWGAPLGPVEVANRLFSLDAWTKPASYFDDRDVIAYVRALSFGMRRFGEDLIGVTRARYVRTEKTDEFLRRMSDVLKIEVEELGDTVF